MKLRNKKAQSLIEYGLILALVAVIAVAALQILGSKVNDAATSAGKNIDGASDNAARLYCESIGMGYDEASGICTGGTGTGTGGT